MMITFVALRVVPAWPHLVPADGDPVLLGNDAYYHLWQATHSMEHFPALLREDALSRYPAVMRDDAAGLFDLGLAAIAKALVAVSGWEAERALKWVCLWAPPLLGALLIPLVFRLVRQFAPVPVAFGMASWCLILPGESLLRTTLGFCDHHVVEMILGVLAVGGWVRLVRAERTGSRPWWRPAWAAALPLALLQFTWLGGPLFLPIFALTLLAQFLADDLAGAGVAAIARAGTRYWIAFLLMVGAVGLGWPDARLEPGLWRQTLVGGSALLAMLAGARTLFTSTRFPGGAPVRAVGALVVGGLGVTLVLLLVPAARELLGIMIRNKQGLVEENITVTLAYYFTVTGIAGLLAILTPVIGNATGLWRQPGWLSGVLPSLLLIALWCRTSDYGYHGALHATILSGVLLGAKRGNQNNASTWWGHAPAVAALSSVLLLMAGPLNLTTPLWPKFEGRLLFANPGWRQAMQWLRGKPVRSSAAGVLTDWNTGNLVVALGRHPATASRYPDPEGLAPFFGLTEASVRAAPLRGSTVAAAVRYVAIEPQLIGLYLQGHLALVGVDASRYQSNRKWTEPDGRVMTVPTLGGDYDRAFATRLLLEDGNGMEHFRLVYESPSQSFLRLTFDPKTYLLNPVATPLPDDVAVSEAQKKSARNWWIEPGQRVREYSGQVLASVKLFEQVTGARIEGRTTPGLVVRLTIPLRLTSSGRRFQYRQIGTAAADGHFFMTVPYATTGPSDSDVEPAGAASLELDGWSKAIEIPEAAVQEGGVISIR